MNKEVKPLPAIVIILFFMLLIFAYAWANGKAADISAPNGIYKNQNNQLFIRIGTELLQFDDGGQYIKNIDLQNFGIESATGPLLFTPKNEIILRRGKDTRTFTQNIKSYLRMEDTTSITPKTNTAGLFRCNLGNLSCYRFTESPMDFNNLFYLEYDTFDNGVFLADISRHRLLKFDEQGQQLFEYSDKLKYPNQLKLIDNQLYLTNTNHHVITLLDVKQKSLRFNRDFDVVPQTAKDHQETWPATLQRVNDHWWVINMKNTMTHGGIYIFDDNWKFIRRINSAADADPVNILQWHENEILVDEPNNFILNRYTASGIKLAPFAPKELQNKLDSQKSLHKRFTLLSYLPAIIFIIAVIYGLIIGYRQQPITTNQNKTVADTSKPIISPAAEIKWLEIDCKYIRKIKTMALMAPLFLALSISPFALITDNFETFTALAGILIPFYAFFFILSTASFFYLKTLGKVKIGIQGETITLNDHRGKSLSQHICAVYYDNTTIYFDKIAVIYGNKKRPFFDQHDVEKYLLPLLNSANKTSPLKMFYLLYKAGHPAFYFTLFILSGAIMMLLFL